METYYLNKQRVSLKSFIKNVNQGTETILADELTLRFVNAKIVAQATPIITEDSRI